MSIPILSLLILLFVILISTSQRVNIGILSLILAWTLGYWIAGMKAFEVIAGFPGSMFMVLVAISYFFGIASHNGTLDKITSIMIRIVKGQRAALPVIFFIIAMVLSTVGAGNIGAVALLAPVAMRIADKTALGAFFMTILLIYGANAGTFSPFAFTGIIANGLVTKIGLPMNPWTEIYLPNFLVQTFLALINYLIFYFLLKKRGGPTQKFSLESISPGSQPFNTQQVLTLSAILVLIIGVVFFKINVGLLAMILGILLTLIRVAHGLEEFKLIPWKVVIMVCGMSTLISIIEKVGGMNILITGLAQISNSQNVTGILAFVVGIISSFSSSSAVVMPTFIPLVPGLIEKMGGGDPVALVSSINIGAHLVDVSPLSTLGALCLANAAFSENKIRLFRKLLIYGLSMSVVGAAVSYLFFGKLLPIL
ncbi:MAG: SLC13 family permease [Candidatus Omnitrophica bacterium]|nr:SLC13 family permease [Candidatus Omnitrophota bacterium]